MTATNTETKWMGKNAQPKKDGWHHVRHENGSFGVRLFEDGAWWYPSPQYGYKPNDSFVEWLNVEEIHSRDNLIFRRAD